VTVSTGYIVFPNCKTRDEEDCCKALSKITCMIKCQCCTGECPQTYNRTPYYEFDNFLAFIDNIPFENAKGYIGPKFKQFDSELREYIKGVKDYSSFDALVPYLYNVDLFNGLCRGEYDVHYLTWFINSFNLYLCSLYPVPLVYVNPTGLLCYVESKEEVDLLCLTCCNLCTFACPAAIFNRILSSTVNWPLILDFINLVLAQIKCGTKCTSRGCNDCSQNGYTTYTSYRDVFTAALNATKAIIVEAHEARLKYFGGNFLTSFAVIPYQSTPTATPTVTTNLSTFMLIPLSALNFDKLVDF